MKRPDDSLELHFNDTVSGGDWLCDQDVVEYFVKQAPRELVQLEHWGCPWSREVDGSVAVRPFGGMKKERTWYAADKSGFHILHTLFQTSLQHPSIKRYDEYFALDLLHEDGRCCGVVAHDFGIRADKLVASIVYLLAATGTVLTAFYLYLIN